MLCRTSAAFALLSLVSCAAVHSKSAVSQKDSTTPGAVFVYHANVTSVAQGSTRVTLRVRLPWEGPLASAHAVEAHGLVGNAPFDFGTLVQANGTLPSGAGDASMSIKGSPAVLTSRVVTEGDARGQELVVETAGKPVEFAVRLSVAPGVPVEAAALESQLAKNTSATSDGRPIEAIATRLERVR